MIRKTLKVLSGVVAAVVLAAVVFYAWAVWTTNAGRARVYEAHTVDIPMPYPLSQQDVADLRAQKLNERLQATQQANAASGGIPATGVAPAAVQTDPLIGVDLAALTQERALARGKHLVAARYGCFMCHGADFSGGTMVDSAIVGTLKGPNLTTGKGSVTASFKMSDWERAIRHGVRPDGTPLIMPSEDFAKMTNQELSDVVLYIRSMPAVDNEVPAPAYGPLINVLLATGQVKFSADTLAATTTHVAMPPPAGPTVDFGEHLSHTCSGCHRADFSGGPIKGGDPSWAPAANLTPQMLKNWTYAQFDKALRSGVAPNGSPLKAPMSVVLPMLASTTEDETRALWMYLQSLPPEPTGS